jgi:L-alanine-DL-glutamate epimerase-like enolase superfamily enzyme
MKIESISTQVKCIPLQTPFITALRRVENVEFVQLEVKCVGGFLALGEAPATKAITGEDLEIISNSIASVKELLLGLEPKQALKVLHETSIGSSAKAAVDMALVALLAQEKNKELYEYLGAKEKCEIQTDITISLNTTQEMLGDARLALIQGLNILKVKLGSDIKHAITTTQLLRSELLDAKLLIDANQAWNLEESLEYIDAVKDLKIELIEQPVIASDLDAMTKITQASNIPILADESAFNLEDVKKVLQKNAADMINIKLMKCGGITKAVEILEYAREKNIKCMLGSMLEGRVSIKAAEHLAMAYGDVIKYVDLDSPLLYKKEV